MNKIYELHVSIKYLSGNMKGTKYTRAHGRSKDLNKLICIAREGVGTKHKSALGMTYLIEQIQIIQIRPVCEVLETFKANK